MPTFTQALTVTPGERTTADQCASLAAAFNSRLPYGDACWRILFLFHSLMRKPRNDDGTLEAPDAEWWTFYAHVDPADGEWPLSGPGDPEGGNVANIAMAFVYGPEQLETGSELQRLASVPVGITGISELEPRHIWYLGQVQRGAYDTVTGEINSISFSVAQTYGYIRQGLLSPHGNSYGGFIATNGTSDFLFTSLVDGSTVTYSRLDYEIIYSPWSYYAYHLTSGLYVTLQKRLWIEGPYDGESYLRKTSANMLARGINAFTTEFRGTEGQGAGTTNLHAFDFEKFFTTQYPLAPQIGTTIGEFPQPYYPSWEQAGPTAAAGEIAIGATFDWPEGSVCTGFIFIGSKLTEPCTVTLNEDGEPFKSFTIPVGDSDEIWWLPTARRLRNVDVDITDLSTEVGGKIFIEATALLEYAPQLHDLYLVDRLSSFTGSIERIDGSGPDFNQAKEIGDALYSNGCIIPLVDTGDGLSPAGFDPTFNQNAVYDASRRWIRSMARIVPRQNLTGYAVIDGKSVLWFNRTALGPPGITTRDMFEDIGPEREVTSIKWGRAYLVTAGVVTYGPENARVSYQVGDELTGLQNITEWFDGGTLIEADGIRATAEPRDFSNRWIMTVLSLKPFHTSNSSVWKTDAFADTKTPFWQRSLFYCPEVEFSSEYQDHMTYGEAWLIPESPSAYSYGRINDATGENYANEWDGSGDPDNVARFFKSCRLYEPALEIESAVMDGDELKITLNGRLQYHEDAPASIARDLSTWVVADIDAEDYRTDENGIRQTLAMEGLGWMPSLKVGDGGINSNLAGLADAPLASCLPTFGFVKMIPEPYLDGNDTQQEHDSYRIHDVIKQAEVYLRGMCEAYVDGVTSAENSCAYLVTAPFDYTYEQLMFQASGNRWCPFDSTVRPDNPFTFGPNPNQKFYAEQFNALANGINLLTDLRVMLPVTFESRGNSGSSTTTIELTDSCGLASDCSAVGTQYFASGTGQHSASVSVTGSWGAFVDGQGANQGYEVRHVCTGSGWQLYADVTTLDVRWSLDNPDAAYALPGDLASLLDTNSVAIMGITEAVTINSLIRTAAPIDGNLETLTGECSGSYLWTVASDVGEGSYCGSIMGSVTAPSVPAAALRISQWDLSGAPGTASTANNGSSKTVEIYSDGTGIVRCPTEAYAGDS